MTNSIDHLIAKVLSGEASQEEQAQLEEWLNSNPEHFTEFIRIQSFWESREFQSPTTTADITVEADNAYERFKHKKLTKESRGNKKIYLYASLAAVAALALVLILVGKPFGTSQIETFTFTTQSEKDTLLLPDSSTAILNKNSKLVYTSSYNQKERHLKLEGEGFFDVHKNAAKPFIVELTNSRITVLGTAFNVRAYNNDDFVKATLVRGVIRFDRDNGRVTLKPHQELSYDKRSSQITIRNIEIESSMLWLKDVYRFESTSLQYLLNELGAIYDLNIVIADGQLAKTILSGSFQKDQTISEILNILSSTVPISWDIQNQTVTIRQKE